MEEAGNQQGKPGGEADALDGLQDKGVVHRVEGFSGIHEEDKFISRVEEGGGFGLHHLVKELVELPDMVLEGAAGDKAFLVGEKGPEKEVRDRPHHGFRDDAVVRVGDGDGAGVIREEGSLLREEKEKTVVVPVGGELPAGQCTEDLEEDRSSVPGDTSPGSERDAVRTSRRVVGAYDGLLQDLDGGNEGQGHARGGAGVLPVVGVRADGLLLGLPGGPDGAPVSGSEEGVPRGRPSGRGGGHEWRGGRV